MTELVALLIRIALPLLVVVLAMITGTICERRHFQAIARREQALGGLPALTVKEYPADRPVSSARMVTGSVVVSIDHFKRFLASLRNIFGGEVRSYCSLLDRGRREAILRMKESCPDADLIINMRVETSSVSQGAKKTLGSTEVLVYGTALTFADQAV